jgi:uncharacterized protein YlxW (UPF0749 family)
VKSWVWQVTILSVLLGALFAASVRTEQRTFEVGRFPGTRLGQRQMITEMEKTNLDLRAEILSLREKNTAYEAAISSNESASRILNEQLQAVKVSAGLVAVHGPGVTVTMDDSRQKPPSGMEFDYIVHDSDIRTVVNELWIAGAEAISINGQRVVASTGIRCPGPVTQINGVPISPPYVIKAIGPADTLESALKVYGGVLDEYSPYLRIKVERAPDLLVEAFSGGTQLRYAVPVEPESKEGK